MEPRGRGGDDEHRGAAARHHRHGTGGCIDNRYLRRYNIYTIEISVDIISTPCIYTGAGAGHRGGSPPARLPRARQAQARHGRGGGRQVRIKHQVCSPCLLLSVCEADLLLLLKLLVRQCVCVALLISKE